MEEIGRAILRSIIQGKWLYISYKNRQELYTKYWIAISDIDVKESTLKVDAFNLSKGQETIEFSKIHISGIKQAKVIEGSFQKNSEHLKERIESDPLMFASLFNSNPNLNILDYLVACNRSDVAPYQTNYKMIRDIDESVLLTQTSYSLSLTQFEDIVSNLHFSVIDDKKAKMTQELCLNVISIVTDKGLFILAHRRLLLDVKNKSLIPSQDIVINREFSIHGEVQSIRQYMPEEEMDLLDDVVKNRETILDILKHYSFYAKNATDSPFIICLESDIQVDLNSQYDGIRAMFANGDNPITVPIQAFFGQLKTLPRRYKEYPIILLDKHINLDQLVAIDHTMRFPVTYVQGPPGTGKTSTILNAIITGFFNEKTMLVTSYNNHPMDGVYDKIRKLSYKGSPIPFPAIRLGNAKITEKALEDIKELFLKVKDKKILEEMLNRKKEKKELQVKSLALLLTKHEKRLDLLERKAAVEKLMDHADHFTLKLQTTLLADIDRELTEIGEVTDADALALIDTNNEDFLQYLYFTSAKYIKRLEEPKYSDLLALLEIPEPEKRVAAFNQYTSNPDNLHIFQRVFPIIITTNISSYHLGMPKPSFDITVMDEASQCDVATGLIPIVRGENLLLVGDPQQLNPVISLDPKANAGLMKKFSVGKEYDYCGSSIYKTFIAADSVSEEILLSCHYRCNPSIIAFNNQKFYNGKLKVKTETKAADPVPLEFIDCPKSETDGKNTSKLEVHELVEYIQTHPKENIGIITPFVRQKEFIDFALKEKGINNVTCGTVHAFQGDEKDVILFSTAITSKTSPKTYSWLKENKELQNVAVSRAAKKLVILSDKTALDNLNPKNEQDDFKELCDYVRTNGVSTVSRNGLESRALGFKPWSTEIEDSFLENLEQALHICDALCTFHKEVPISQVFNNDLTVNDLFFTGRFDFVVYRRNFFKKEIPVFAIELNGPEHKTDALTIARDKKKAEICKKRKLTLIQVDNVYARRYNHIKEILENFFKTNAS